MSGLSGVLGEDLFIVEKILKKKRTEDGELRYLVKWDGYAEEENTWEPPESFSGCPQVLEDFERKVERRGRKSGNPSAATNSG